MALHLTPPKASACRLPKGLSTPGSIWNSDFPECGERRCSKPAFANTKTRPDKHFLFDRHPQAENVWLAGGGSGHGYKHGPAVGERLAGMMLGKRPIDPFFSLVSRQKGRIRIS